MFFSLSGALLCCCSVHAQRRLLLYSSQSVLLYSSRLPPLDRKEKIATVLVVYSKQ